MKGTRRRFISSSYAFNLPYRFIIRQIWSKWAKLICKLDETKTLIEVSPPCSVIKLLNHFGLHQHRCNVLFFKATRFIKPWFFFFFSELCGQVQTHEAIQPEQCEVEVEQRTPLSVTSSKFLLNQNYEALWWGQLSGQFGCFFLSRSYFDVGL